jgi:hypothetical protein
MPRNMNLTKMPSSVYEQNSIVFDRSDVPRARKTTGAASLFFIVDCFLNLGRTF